ncbi:MAG: hypothetical protein R3301_04325 [Saprospiraceae bacterium]|nr:hypothetical protein [Saprospiraceae bacterium]
MRGLRLTVLFLLATFFALPAQATNSVAREWNEVLLDAIRVDFARPTVHARNLFHTSIAMYDAWAVYDQVADTYFLGNTVDGYNCPFNGIPTPSNVDSAREETLSYAVYRLLLHRFEDSPGAATSIPAFHGLMLTLGFDTAFVSLDYSGGSAAALGNYIADRLIDFGLQDGANEANGYANTFYEPMNPTLIPIVPGNPDIIHPNHWQPLTLDVFIDQAGNVYPVNTPDFLSPEWGVVSPFALTPSNLNIYMNNGNEYWVYHDPGPPPFMDTTTSSGLTHQYRWGHEMVAWWSSHLDPSDSVMIDISPATFGNTPYDSLPTNWADFHSFFDSLGGGQVMNGWAVNPVTGMPYAPNIVPRGDYTRVLAEFWADGPDSETPPGHWFTILNYVSDYPGFEKRFQGVGPILPDLEWDIKTYFILGGAVHDAAVSAWGAKGYYDYLRPISAIRMMADYGQCTDTTLPSYHPAGLHLVPGYVELVEIGDPLAGASNEHVGKIKLYAWRGPDYIADPETDVAGVGWILAENWWPYQRPSFVTPPFAGYVSGHSTFSRAAAEVMTLMTGSEFFPGGLGEFFCPMNSFLVFEDGPSVDITLQWATYRDASDQTSLSRIWGGIHPPADDIPGRLMGYQIGIDAFNFALPYFDGTAVLPVELIDLDAQLQPDGTVRVTWRTASEVNSDRFVVMRSKNGLNYREIGEVAAAGQSSTPLQYTFVDTDILREPIAYYQLKLFDLDGAFRYSGIVSCTRDQSHNTISLQPNPVVESLLVSLSGLEAQPVTIDIHHAAGIKVRSKSVDAYTAPIEMQLGDLPGGLYYAVISSGNNWSETRKFVIQ